MAEGFFPMLTAMAMIGLFAWYLYSLRHNGDDSKKPKNSTAKND